MNAYEVTAAVLRSGLTAIEIKWLLYYYYCFQVATELKVYLFATTTDTIRLGCDVLAILASSSSVVAYLLNLERERQRSTLP